MTIAESIADCATGGLRATPVHILLVEDNPADVRLVEEMLRCQGCLPFELVVAQDGQGAVARIVAQPPEVILLDLGLPDGQALETLLKIHAAAPGLPIVVLSANNDERLALQALQLGAQDFLVKWDTNGHLLSRAICYAIERKQLQDRLYHLAHHDPLTGLANRKHFYDRLRQCLAGASRNERLVACFFVDLVNFKEINDLYGHAAGDEVLRIVGRRLSHCVRITDAIGRLGGDEFALAVTDLTAGEAVTTVADKLIAAFQTPVHFEDRAIPIHASIGGSLYPVDGEEVEVLVRKADYAMYQAKEEGGAAASAVRFYCSAVHEATGDLQERAQEIRRALAAGEFRVHYQPQIGMRSQRVLGVEALLRWERANGQWIYPSEILSLLEETGLIVELGTFVLRESCRQGQAWREAGIPPLTMSVNCSQVELKAPGFLAGIRQALADTGFDPHYLALEFHEADLVGLQETGKEILHALDQDGVQITLDHFWSGPASLRLLTEIPVRNIKLDRSLLQEISTGGDHTAVIKTVTEVAHLFRIHETIIGVESAAQMDLLRATHCDGAQGYAISRALSAEDCLVYLRQGDDGQPPAPA